MHVPAEVPVMTLPDATLFPQALLPLYIFEPRYRKMLSDALETHRMFIVARQRPGMTTEMPETVAGLGMIRVCVGHADGTSHLVLQGMTRVRIQESIRNRPYPVVRVEPIRSIGHDSVAQDALVAKVRELGSELLQHKTLQSDADQPPSPESLLEVSAVDILRCLDSMEDPETLTDLVSRALLRDASDRQAILEIEDVESRLRRLIQFLLAQVRRQRDSLDHE